jgi:hypothetical protein
MIAHRIETRYSFWAVCSPSLALWYGRYPPDRKRWPRAPLLNCKKNYCSIYSVLSSGVWKRWAHAYSFLATTFPLPLSPLLRTQLISRYEFWGLSKLVSYLYSGGARLKSRPGQLLYWFRFVLDLVMSSPKIVAVLGGSLVITAWHVLRLRMEETALQIWRAADNRQRVVLQLGCKLAVPHRKNKLVTKWSTGPWTWTDYLDKHSNNIKKYNCLWFCMVVNLGLWY